MAEQWQIRRGTTAENDDFTGAMGELSLDTDKGVIRVHNGETQGGGAFIDTIVGSQLPTAENNYTWYRRYASGWVEQGGILQAQTITAGYGASQTLTLPITMADTNFTVTFGDVSGNTAFQSATISRTTTGGTVYQMNRAGSGSTSIQFSYVVSGMAAQ